MESDRSSYVVVVAALGNMFAFILRLFQVQETLPPSGVGARVFLRYLSRLFPALEQGHCVMWRVVRNDSVQIAV